MGEENLYRLLKGCLAAGWEYRLLLSDARESIEKGDWSNAYRDILLALEIRGAIRMCGGRFEPLPPHEIEDLFEGIRTRDKEKVLKILRVMETWRF